MQPLGIVDRYILRFFYACIGYALIGFSWGAIQSGIPVIRHFLEAPPARFIILAHGHINLLGWVEMAIFGASYYIIPKILQREVHSERLVKVHFWTHNLGLCLMVIGFFVAGYKGGQLFWAGNPQLIAAAKGPWMGVVGMGGFLVLGANAIFGWNIYKTARARG
ncbi:MAG: cbb3-type cytochrome c oxidase subunit I [Nitrospirota bacterium]|nr:cbb3-type cytochrome c oxidase subunit I [Nitrospirota bacterium]